MKEQLNLDALVELDRAATPGPWYLRHMDDDLCCAATAVATRPNTSDDNDQLCDSAIHGIVAATYVQNPAYVLPEDGRGMANAELIASMRNAWPELLRLARMGLAAERETAGC